MTDQKTVLTRALHAIDGLEARLRKSETRLREPIAVVGMSCRVPGAASPFELWELLISGGDAIRELPVGRWEITRNAAMRDDTSKRVAGGFIDGIDLFDPGFFGIAPREALTMDPQQRLVLEGVWLALEDAAQPPDALVGSATGVFVGITTSDYGQLTRGLAEDVYIATGSALNAASGRVSYALGLQGPCMAIDTACSSSLVATHVACQSLRAGDCDLALAGGVNALLSPEPFELFSRWGMLAPDGRCKTFDARANGFTRGEGCGVLVLKRLSDALADGNRILATIRGSAVNQDGRSSGLSVPNGPAQEKVLRAALQHAGVAPADVDYVEAHGTGTVLGDPIEVEALGAVYGEGRPADRPLRIGSIKTNVGHLESASGVAGLCKTILSLQHEIIPPHLHFHEPNPRIPWGELALRVPSERSPWPRGDRPRFAGVSAFGFTGTNAHVVLEEAPLRASAPAANAPAHLFVVSGKSGAAVRAIATNYSDALAVADAARLGELSRTAGAGRSHFAHRAAVVAATPEEAASGLRRVAERESVAQASAPPRIAFLFSGQGAQRAGMGRELYESSPRVRDVLDHCARVCNGRMDVPLLDALFAPAREALGNTAVTQPALFALEYALAELWDSWGIRPAVVLGHSLGEYVAACVAGAMDLEDALLLVVERGRLMAELPAGGAMAAIFAPADVVQPLVAARMDALSIAALNGPDNTVVSGTHAAVAELCREMAARGVECRDLAVSHAFHSPLMEPILDRLEALADRVPSQPPRVPLAANLDGRVVADGQVLDGSYWRRHAREPVQFGAGLHAARGLGCDTFLEIGPAATLLGLARRAVGGAGTSLLPSVGTDGEWRTLLQSLGRLYELGADVDWSAVTAPYANTAAPLPGYVFDRRSFWVDTSRKAAAPVGAAVGGAHPLLGVPQEVAAEDLHLWISELDLERLPYLTDHRVQGAAIVPATAYIEIGLAAAAQLLGECPVRLSKIVNEKPLILRPNDRFLVQTRLSREDHERWRFEVHSRDAAGNGAWVRHVRGELSSYDAPRAEAAFNPHEVRARCREHIAGEEFYRRLANKGNEWGPSFQSMVEVWRGEGEAIARVCAVDAIVGDLSGYRFHPALSDAAGHVLVANGPLDRSASALGGALVGGGMEEVRQYAAPVASELWAHAVLKSAGEGPANVITGDVRVYDSEGRLVSETLGARLWFLGESGALDPAAELYYRVEWQAARPKRAIQLAASPDHWYLLADQTGVADALAPLLEPGGARVTLVRPGPAYRETDTAVYLDPSSDADWESLLGGVAGPDALLGFVHLWGLESAVNEGGAVEPLVRRDLAAAQALARYFSTGRARARLWIATCGAQPVVPGTTLTDPDGAALWGFGRALGVEHRELWGGLVDLDPDDDPGARAAALRSVITASDAEPAMAARRGTLHVPRLRRVEIAAPEHAPAWEGCALISGGLGGLGLEVAARLAARGCRSLILVGRRVPPAHGNEERWGPVRARIDALREMGADVRVEAVDVTDATAVGELAQRLEREGVAPVRTLIHAAGVMHYGPAAQLSEEELRAVLAAKVQGSCNLAAAFPADRLVLFSSTSSLLPSPLMAGYAAGNAFMDALAHDLRGRGVRAISINWGTWNEAGMATRFVGRGEGATLTALRTLSNHEALDALEAAVAADATQLAVMRMDWPLWERLYPDFVSDPFFEEMVTPSVASEQATARVRLDLLPSLDSDARHALLSEYLADCIGGILGVAASEMDRHCRITQMGFDSLMALEAKNRIESDLGLLIPMVRLLEGPSIEELVEELVRDLAAGIATPVRTTPASLEALVEGEL